MLSIRRIVVTACSTAIVATGLALPQAAAGAADTKVHLPFTAYTNMLVDEVHGHLYFTSGSSTLTITDLTGGNAVTRSGLAGAVGLAMSPDGKTVYVAAESANEIAAVDTSTLAVTTPFTGLSCPRYLAVAGGKLYFSYGCTAGQGNLGSIDVGSASPTVSNSLITDYWYGPPYIASGGATSNVLGAGDDDSSPSKLITYDVSSGTPTKLAQNQTDVCDNFQAMALTSTGAQMAVACGAPYHVSVFNTADLSTVDTYGDSSPYPAGVAISSGDSAIAAGFSQHNPNVVVYPFGSPTSPTASFDLQAGGQGFLVADGMRFGPSGNLYVVVPTSVYRNDFDLFVLHGPALPGTTITASAPTKVSLGQSVTVSGRVTSAKPLSYPVSLRVTRHDLAGTHTLSSVTTDGSGRFSFKNTPKVGGSVTYTVTYAGDSEHRSGVGRATVNVARHATTVTISTNHSRYHYGDTAHITAHLGRTDNSRVVSIYATPYGEGRHLVKRGKVNSNRNLTAKATVRSNTTFTAVFAGDYTYARATDKQHVKAHAKLSNSLEGGYATVNGVRLYHTGEDPVIDATLRPFQLGTCVTARAQRYSGGSWHTIATRCLEIDSTGRTSGFLYGTHVPGEPYRMRAEWDGSKQSLSANGRWLRFEFRD